MRNCNMPGPAEKPCSCSQENPYIRNEFPVAMAYVPWQKFSKVYEPDKALEAGTIFPELDKPFYGSRGMGR